MSRINLQKLLIYTFYFLLVICLYFSSYLWIFILRKYTTLTKAYRKYYMYIGSVRQNLRKLT